MQLTIIVPTFNEAPNIPELVRRICAALDGADAEILFVDDSTDDTPAVVLEAARTAPLPVRLIHREIASGGLGGAVVEGLAAARFDVCIVMDGDLQHPPEALGLLIARYRQGDVDVVATTRYHADGSTGGLAHRGRVFVSRASTLLTKAMFPIRLKDVSDPMTGCFLVDRRALTLSELKPRGYKILLEMLARESLRVAEVPIVFADRHAGESKASLRQGMHFLGQLTQLRFGKMSLFAVIGGLGAIANVAIVWMLTQLGVQYVAAAVIAAEATIIGNFLLIERFVFQDMKGEASHVWWRFTKSFTFNNAELVVRIPVVALMVGTGHVSVVIATAVTLVVAFIVRFVFHSLVVYAPRKPGKRSPIRHLVEELDAQAMSPGEL